MIIKINISGIGNGPITFGKTHANTGYYTYIMPTVGFTDEINFRHGKGSHTNFDP